MIPSEPSQLSAIGIEAGRAVEIVVRQQDLGLCHSLYIEGYDFAERMALVRVGAIFTDADMRARFLSGILLP